MQLQKWFNGLNRKQLILVRIAIFFFSIPAILLWGLGILIIVIWLYLEFGKERKL